MDSTLNSMKFKLFLALNPSKIAKTMDFDGINFNLISKLRIEDKVKFEGIIIPPPLSTNIYLSRNAPIVDPIVKSWVLFVSGGVGIFLLIIAVIIMIKVRKYLKVELNSNEFQFYPQK